MPSGARRVEGSRRTTTRNTADLSLTSSSIKLTPRVRGYMCFPRVSLGKRSRPKKPRAKSLTGKTKPPRTIAVYGAYTQDQRHRSGILLSIWYAPAASSLFMWMRSSRHSGCGESKDCCRSKPCRSMMDKQARTASVCTFGKTVLLSGPIRTFAFRSTSNSSFPPVHDPSISQNVSEVRHTLEKCGSLLGRCPVFFFAHLVGSIAAPEKQLLLTFVGYLVPGRPGPFVGCVRVKSPTPPG